jgi:hypothetical protein
MNGAILDPATVRGLAYQEANSLALIYPNRGKKANIHAPSAFTSLVPPAGIAADGAAAAAGLVRPLAPS